MMFRTWFVAMLASSALVFAAGCSSGDSTGSSGSSGGEESGGTKKGGKTDTGKTGGETDEPTPAKDTSPTEPKKKSYGSQCKDSSECESDFCIFQGGGSIGMCTKTCEDNIDCPGLGQK